ncbi:hypothetical protein [Nocardioides sp. TF02-7]|uniref:hypothetical protein n=1 Tax=Nocardioides sp. TF02-7 TaxID=2917724 RepID=UPI001F06DAEA|nr:hypothetical protein [Nocardioides sp. TF02-7]UMG91707.1 hypothetical protein MF408_16735 [Nocardioides sp. TF02-7]
MSATPDPEQARGATQAAVDATATAYTDDPATDVDQRLRAELEQRGLTVDDAWVAEVAHRIRSGHHVSFDGDST